MKEDLIFDALNEISDKYIAEAVTYEPKVKAFKWKNVLVAAACLIVVAVSAFALLNGGEIIKYVKPSVSSSSVPTVSDSTTVNYAPTMQPTTAGSTTVAGTNETTTSAGISPQPIIKLYSTCPVLSYEGWEEWAFSSCYHQINIGDVTYSTDTANKIPVSSEKLGSILYEFQWNDYRYLRENEESFTVVIYEIKDIGKEKAVAVGRKDGLQIGCFPYFSYGDLEFYSFFESVEALGDLANGINKNYDPSVFCTDYWVCYKQDGKEDIIYSISIDTMTDLYDLMIKNSGKVAVNRTSTTGARLIFKAYIKENLSEICLCNDGYFYITYGTVTKAFNIGMDAYNEFMEQFKSSSCIWTPEHPVTMG